MYFLTNTRRPRKIKRSLLSSLFLSSLPYRSAGTELMDGRKGKKAALAVYCAAQQGLISQTDYTSITDRFGDIGTRQNYNRFFANPQRFTDLEIEATTNFIHSLINPKGDQSDDAE